MAAARARTRWATALSLALLLASAPVRAGYDEDLAGAEALAAEGRYGDAADVLTVLAGAHPQDYRATLRLAQVRYEAGRMEGAEAAFRRAEAISGGAREARLGLGWTLLALEREDEAADAFRAVLREHPGDAEAARGLEIATAPSWHLHPGVALVRQAYPEDPVVPGAWGVGVRLDAELPRGILAGLVYRATWFEVEVPGFGGRMGPRTVTEREVQQEVWGMAGWASEAVGVTAHVGRVGDEGPRPSVTVAGLALRWSPWGDVTGEASWSDFGDLQAVRGALAWRLPLGRGAFVEPGGAVQGVDGDVLGTGFASLGWQGEAVTLRAGGKIGLEERPAYLGQPAVWNLRQRIQGGAWAGAAVSLGAGWSLTLDYELHLLEASEPAPAGPAHLGALGVIGML